MRSAAFSVEELFGNLSEAVSVSPGLALAKSGISDIFMKHDRFDEYYSHIGLLYVKTFRRRYDAETRIADLAPKFRCANCGKRGSRFWDAWQMSQNV